MSGLQARSSLLKKNEYEINGSVTTIFLKRKNGEIIKTLIDTSDLNLVSEFPNTWFAQWDKHTKSFYVCGNKRNEKSEWGRLIIHRLLTSCPKDMQVDHVNHNTLDNRQSNLRIVTIAENLQNLKGIYKSNTSGIRGVDRKNSKWRARVQLNKKPIHLGYFDDVKEAERVAIESRKKLFPNSKEAMQ